MDTDPSSSPESLCRACGARCCIGACPPLSPERAALILSRGAYGDCIEYAGYRRIRLRENGECAMLTGGTCAIHAFKPETCKAGPFTFAVSDAGLEIYLKQETICPLAGLLRADPARYREHYRVAIGQITGLVASLSASELRVISAIPEDATELVEILPLPAGVRHDRD